VEVNNGNIMLEKSKNNNLQKNGSDSINQSSGEEKNKSNSNMNLKIINILVITPDFITICKFNTIFFFPGTLINRIASVFL